MFFKALALCAALAVAKAGHLLPAAPGFGFVDPTIGRIEHLAPTFPIAKVDHVPGSVASSYRTDVVSAPSVRYASVAPAAPLAIGGYAAPYAFGHGLGFGHGYGYAGAPFALGNGYGHAGAPFAYGHGYAGGFGLNAGYGYGYVPGFGYAKHY